MTQDQVNMTLSVQPLIIFQHYIMWFHY